MNMAHSRAGVLGLCGEPTARAAEIEDVRSGPQVVDIAQVSWIRGGLFGALLACAALPVPAWTQSTYKVEVRPTLNDLPVTIETVPNEGALIVKLTNGGTVKVRCDLRYDASPQPLRRSHVYVEPGKTEQNAFRATRKWFSVVVDVTCKPSDKS